MVSLGLENLSFKGSVPKRSYSSLADYGRNAHKKKLKYLHEKKRWEVEIKLLQYNPRKIEQAITEVSTLTRGVTLESLKICLSSFSIHVMIKDTYPDTVQKTKRDLTRKRETRENIMLMLQRMMNLPQRESDKKLMILQVMKNMF